MGFNWTTFGFEVINFLVLVWLLRGIVYRPLARGIEARRQAIAEREQAADERMAAAEAREAEYETRAQALEELRRETVREATEQAAEERARMLAQAREDAAAERSRAQHLVEVEREAAATWIRELAVERATELAGKMLMQLAPDAVDAALFDMLVAEIEAQRELICRELGIATGAEARLGAGEARAGADERPEIEVVGAHMPAEAELERLRAALAAALGTPPRLILREDDSLVAGALVRVGHRVLDASIAGQIDLLRARAQAHLDAEVVHA
ncbi:F0F1 ATP synthase subunit delta [Haliangium sp.]|uniref:F0F1 ATP synthase subunit delta n=1 Tax=Haliangium sp. TaxID=2663208 RepID=UPI003D119B81